jgi:type I restriction enzyme S subunit
MKLAFIKDIKKSGKPCKPLQGTIKYVDTGNVINGKIQGYQEFSFDEKPSRANVSVDVGDVIFAKMQNSLKVIQITEKEKDFVYSTGFYSFNDQRVLPGYLKHYFNSNQFNHIKDKLSKGATMKAINDSGMEQITINVPTTSQQESIVSTLDKINELIDANKRQLELLDEAVKARFVEMFGDIKEKINISRIAFTSSGFSFKSKDIGDNNKYQDGIKLVQISNVSLRNIDWNVINYLPNIFYQKYKTYSLLKDDIVIALTRPIIQSLGNVKVCIARDIDLPALLNQRVAMVRCKGGQSPIYLYYCLQQDDFTQYVKRVCTGSSQPNMSTKDIENYQIPEVENEFQRTFEKFVKAIDKVKLLVTQNLDTLNSMLDKKMDEYFGGDSNA